MTSMTKTPRIGFFLYQGVSCLEIPESGLGFQPSDPKGRCWGSVSPVLGLLPSPFSDLLLNERLHGCAGSSTWCGRPPTPNQPIIASRARNDHRPLRAALCGVLTRRAHLPMVGGPAVGGTRVDRTYQHHPVWVSWLEIPKQCSPARTPRQGGPGMSFKANRWRFSFLARRGMLHLVGRGLGSLPSFGLFSEVYTLQLANSVNSRLGGHWAEA